MDDNLPALLDDLSSSLASDFLLAESDSPVSQPRRRRPALLSLDSSLVEDSFALSSSASSSFFSSSSAASFSPSKI